MTSAEFYDVIQLPEGVIEQLNEYEKQRNADIPDEIMEKLFKREAWDDGVKELQEFRIGSLEYEFVDTNGHREVEVHIPSDADMSYEALSKSVKDFLEFEKEYMQDWVGVPLTTLTWMIMPELEEFLEEGSNILTFRRLFDIEFVDYNQNWYMGWIFPGYSEVNEELPEKTTLHRRLKEHLLSGKRFGVAKGHLVLERVL